jgi:nitrate reductase gamma subunit
VLTNAEVLQHLSRLYENQSKWLFRPERVDWGEQIVLVTGGKLQTLTPGVPLMFDKVHLALGLSWQTLWLFEK